MSKKDYHGGLYPCWLRRKALMIEASGKKQRDEGFNEERNPLDFSTSLGHHD